MDWESIVALVIFSLLCIYSFLLLRKDKPKVEFSPVKFITRVAIFGAFATILYVIPIFRFKLPFFPSFLDLHFDEIPAFICGFAYGPVSAIAVIAIKTVIKLPMTSTLGVGELTDFILSTLYIVPAAYIYQKRRNLKGVFQGFALSTLIQIAVALILNIYIMVPFYMNLMGIKEESLLALMKVAIPAISDVKWSYGLFAVIPFNLLKDALVFALTFLIYRRIHVLLRYEKKTEK